MCQFNVDPKRANGQEKGEKHYIMAMLRPRPDIGRYHWRSSWLIGGQLQCNNNVEYFTLRNLWDFSSISPGLRFYETSQESRWNVVGAAASLKQRFHDELWQSLNKARSYFTVSRTPVFCPPEKVFWVVPYDFNPFLSAPLWTQRFIHVWPWWKWSEWDSLDLNAKTFMIEVLKVDPFFYSLTSLFVSFQMMSNSTVQWWRHGCLMVGCGNAKWVNF